ncbi:NucA/NucB deoxyribonuclease domain-containing protein [Streptomyces sp. LX-29]|uniref:NucA/NucB deoxyribonuclease domain-containing protein n=1 Tax=Streptomyces sp. LX-29 TaxID=2900152 RepID=UPI00240DC269|nr:NucA/NucB deoxyribonuclease domain-containing protein [Streptomyces sp. LX-29]WFB09227.1 NucA/NucB deoxyribonuclease domain-containing protein [Streptomyces sp. LX-29]
MPQRLQLTRQWKRGAVTACALTLLAATGAAAAPDEGPAAPKQKRYEWVDASTVPAEELSDLPKPVPFSQYQRSRGKNTASRPSPNPKSADEALRKECAKHEKEAKTVKGWIKSRWQSCQKRPYDLVLRSLDGTRDIGRLKFDVWILGRAHDGSRRADYTASVEDIIVQAVHGEDAKKWRIGQSFDLGIDLNDSDPDPKVTEPGVIRRDELLGVWDKNPSWSLTYTSPDKGPQYNKGNLQRVAAMLFMDLNAGSPNALPYSLASSYRSLARFDYAGPVVGKHMGTVFTEARVALRLSMKDPAVNESALHIYDALKRPERTFPSWLGKSVPGSKEPLHRLIDKDEQEENRDKSIATCKEVWGDYKRSGLDCDEYPFASTKEGSNAGNNKFSVRLLSSDDNQTVGRDRLNGMYRANRILDGDPFYVNIVA